MSTPSCTVKGIFCRFGLWSSSASYHQLPYSPLSSEKDDLHVSFSQRKRRPLVPIVTGRAGRKVFLVDPHILEHWLFQDLLHKQWGSMRVEMDYSMEWERDQLFIAECARGKHRPAEQALPHPICLDCDAILFEFFLWLVENDDPSLRDLNLGDLMEFYGAES